jgi:hypothetical protein
MIGIVRVPRWFQGPTGSGQGGWTSARLADLIGRPVTVRLRAPVPLEVDLEVDATADGGWRCRHGELLVAEASPWEPDVGDTAAVTVEQATAARGRFPVPAEDHPVPHCFSCGLQPDGMRVHAGPLGEDPERFATDWTAPPWADRGDGVVDHAVLWAALDCTAAWYACCHPVPRQAVTAQFAVEVLRPVAAGERLALVSWSGAGAPDWEGRKRHASSVAFDAEGQTVARAASFWIALGEPGRLS